MLFVQGKNGVRVLISSSKHFPKCKFRAFFVNTKMSILGINTHHDMCENQTPEEATARPILWGFIDKMCRVP